LESNDLLPRSFVTATVTLPTGKTYTPPDYGAIDGFLDPKFASCALERPRPIM
jgi:hypothetical protein